MECNRCGKPVDKPVGFITFYDYSNPSSAERLDAELCPACTQDFRRWKKGGTA